MTAYDRIYSFNGGGGGGHRPLVPPPPPPPPPSATESSLFCDIKQRRNFLFLTSSSIAITSVTVRSSGVLLETGHVFLMRFIVGVKFYMEVSIYLECLKRQVA